MVVIFEFSLHGTLERGYDESGWHEKLFSHERTRTEAGRKTNGVGLNVCSMKCYTLQYANE
jgi:hypothetical protein